VPVDVAAPTWLNMDPPLRAPSGFLHRSSKVVILEFIETLFMFSRKYNVDSTFCICTLTIAV
jgi:hypothetical protein